MFDDVRLPEEVERGATGGPRFQTSITVLATGREQRNVDWATQRGLWEIGYGIQTKDDFQAVLAFFYARQGKARGFRFKDWSDFEATSTALGTGTGLQTDFQLIKPYTSLVTYNRRITRPVTGTIAVTTNGSPIATWTLQPLGVIRFNTAPAAGVAIAASFQFDVPVRFDTDEFRLNLETFDAGAVEQLSVVELRE
jgi:uncharacterized protein (TIGR02217 family)